MSAAPSTPAGPSRGGLPWRRSWLRWASAGAAALRLSPLVALVALGAAVAAGRPHPGRLAPREAWAPPSVAHPLGCGEAGVDLAAAVAHGGLRALALALAVSGLGLIVGVPLGAAAALARGPVEALVARVCDLVQAFPTFFLAMAVLAVVPDGGRVALGAVLLLSAWAPFARLSLVQTRVLRGLAFLEAARALGLGRRAVLVRHLLPQLADVAGVQLGSSAAAVIVSEAALAFVGLGPRDGVALGAVLDQGVAAMLRAPHVLLVGASAVAALSYALLLAGRAAESTRR